MKTPDGEGLWWFADQMFLVMHALDKDGAPLECLRIHPRQDVWLWCAPQPGDWRRVLTPAEMDEIADVLKADQYVTGSPSAWYCKQCGRKKGTPHGPYCGRQQHIRLLRGEEASGG